MKKITHVKIAKLAFYIGLVLFIATAIKISTPNPYSIYDSNGRSLSALSSSALVLTMAWRNYLRVKKVTEEKQSKKKGEHEEDERNQKA